MLRRLEPTEHSEEYRRVRLPVKLREGAEERALVWVSDPERAAPRWADEGVMGEALLAAHGTAGRGVEYVRTIVHALELWGLSDPLLESVWARLAAWRPR